MERFFVGLHQPFDAHRLPRWGAFISYTRLRKRKSHFKVGDWIMDSGAFSTLDTHGCYPDSPEVYAECIRRFATCGNLLAAVTQDYMCEPHMLAKTGLTIQDHQRLTIERYDALLHCDTGGVYIMPVLQGYDPQDYVAHIRQYGNRLGCGAWVGVGSVCKRNGDPKAIENVLLAIKRERPDLLLHGFGLKKTALSSGVVEALLWSADSMAWSLQARMEGRDGNSWKEAQRWTEAMEARPLQHPFPYMLN